MNAFDYSLVALYFIGMIWLGLRFKQSKAGTDYFLGGRNFGWFPLCMSAMATQLSVISFVSAPAFVGLRKGGGMQWLTFELGVPIAMMIVMACIGPTLLRSGVLSVYSLLEQRFNPTSRRLLSATFLLNRGFSTSVTIYAVCLILSSILGLSFWTTMFVLGGVTVAYSLEGGMKAIVYSEVAQMIIKVLGIILIVACGLHQVGGWSGFITHLDRSRLVAVDFDNFGFDGGEFGFWPMLLGGIFLYCSYYGTDQMQAQRIRDEPTMRRLLFFNGVLRFPVTLAYCFGGLVLGAFAQSNATFAAKIPAGKPDLMVPVFITDYLPHGVIGILVVAIIAAGMSAYSSALNSLSAVTMEDVVSRFVNVPKERYVYWSKGAALVWGIITMLLASVVGKMATTVIEAINKVGSLFYGPILGMFVLALIYRRIKPHAANIGLVLGVLLNFTLWLGFKNVFWFWWNALGGLTTIGCGVLLSCFGGPRPLPPGDAPAPLPAWRFATRENLVLTGFFAAIVAFCVALPHLF
jgi:SSS family transporter